MPATELTFFRPLLTSLPASTCLSILLVGLPSRSRVRKRGSRAPPDSTPYSRELRVAIEKEKRPAAVTRGEVMSRRLGGGELLRVAPRQRRTHRITEGERQQGTAEGFPVRKDSGDGRFALFASMRGVDLAPRRVGGGLVRHFQAFQSNSSMAVLSRCCVTTKLGISALVGCSWAGGSSSPSGVLPLKYLL